MRCDFEAIHDDGTAVTIKCNVCGFILTGPFRGGLIKECAEHQDVSPGTALRHLIKAIGIVPTSTCECNSRMAEMNNRGPDWCREHINTIAGWMRSEAIAQNLVFLESQARWLVVLAITLATEQREPNRFERVRLRAMRLGNRLLNGTK